MYDFQVSKPSRERLPTMYDLPSEDPEESGLPDEFHPTQAQLLGETFRSPVVPVEQCFIGTDINLYYDSRHTQWYKRPDWFLVTGVTSSATIEEMRWSYVIWQESVAPYLVVELLSEGTEEEDLGQTLRVVGKPPTKWEVYEQLLRVPYYVLFDRVTQQLRAFKLDGNRYAELSLMNERLWLDEVQLGLGVWVGRYRGAEGKWLRWYDGANAWIPTLKENVEQEAARAEQEASRAEQEATRAEQAELQLEEERSQLEEERAKSLRLMEQLRSLGVEPE
jgi:Uma2 family endonuclease